MQNQRGLRDETRSGLLRSSDPTVYHPGMHHQISLRVVQEDVVSTARICEHYPRLAAITGRQ